MSDEIKVGNKYKLLDGHVVFSGYVGDAPVSNSDCVKSLNAMNMFIDGNQSIIREQQEQIKTLQDALHLVANKIPIYQNIQGGGYAITLNADDVNIIKETLRIIELK